MAQAAGFGDVRWVELSDPGLLQPGGHEGFAAASAVSFRQAKEDTGGGADVVPDDITWETQVHARFTTA